MSTARGGRRLRFGIKRDARPEARIKHHLDGVLLDVVDDDPLRSNPRIRQHGIENQPRAFVLVLEMRRVHEDQLIVPRSEIDVLLQHLQFVARVFVQPDFADAQHIRPIQKLRNERDHILRQFRVLGFLGIDAEPGEMRQAEFRGALRLVVRQLAKIIVKALRRCCGHSPPRKRARRRRGIRPKSSPHSRR